jgi:hypothetical protein
LTRAVANVDFFAHCIGHAAENGTPKVSNIFPTFFMSHIHER